MIVYALRYFFAALIAFSLYGMFTEHRFYPVFLYNQYLFSGMRGNNAELSNILNDYPNLGEARVITLYSHLDNVSNLEENIKNAEKYNRYSINLIKFQLRYYASQANVDELLLVYAKIMSTAMFQNGVIKMKFGYRDPTICSRNVDKISLDLELKGDSCNLVIPTILFNELRYIHLSDGRLEIPNAVIEKLIAEATYYSNANNSSAVLRKFFVLLNQYSL